MKIGLSEVYALKGGFQGWKKADYPLEPKKAEQQNCIACHEQITPQVVGDWQSSRHGKSANDVSCSICHGTDHSNATDIEEAQIPTDKRCRFCHERDWQSFQKGKHALAWKSKDNIPDYHYSIQKEKPGTDEKSCDQCHKIGLKSASRTKLLWRDQGIYGSNSCANCHTPHTFSRKKANRPQACRPCHSGTQTPQWESYTASRHFQVRQKSSNSSTKRQGPTCQSCHLPDDSHGVQTAWGSIGLRLTLPPEDEEWSKACTDILTALRAYSPQNGSGDLLDTYQHLRFFPVERDDWEKKRRTMIRTCSKCHEQSFAESRLQDADRMIRSSDLLLARGIAILEELYTKRYLEAPDRYSFPSLINSSREMAEAERIVRDMFYIHRKQVKSGSFHAPESKLAQKGLRALEESLDRLRDIREDLEARE